jgi:hypothetical protein
MWLHVLLTLSACTSALFFHSESMRKLRGRIKDNERFSGIVVRADPVFRFELAWRAAITSQQINKEAEGMAPEYVRLMFVS